MRETQRADETGDMGPIRRAVAGDASEIGRVLADGFLEDPVLSWVFEGDADLRLTKLEAFFGFLSSEANIPLGSTYLLDGACACWAPPPGTDPWPEERGRRFNDLLRRACSDGDLERLAVLSAALDSVHPPEPHWYLGSIATLRRLQRAGMGSALLRHGLDVVDRDRSPAYLESTNPRNVAFYERHGFRVTGRIDVPGGPARDPMWRSPSPVVEPG